MDASFAIVSIENTLSEIANWGPSGVFGCF